MTCDYLIVGSGLTGATIARILKDAGKNVLVLERRSFVGGNVHDQYHPSGISFHTYGPHYFRTDDDRIWEYACRFAEFHPYNAVVMTYVDGSYENWPVSSSYICRTVGESWSPDFKGVPSNLEEAALSLMPRLVYEKFIKGYNEKQWGVPARALSPELVKRFDVREDNDPRLMRKKYQGIPRDGYSAFMFRMLSGIPVIVNFDYLKNRNEFRHTQKLIFTGPIDEFFDFDMGRLAYRGQERRHSYVSEAKYVLPCGQVNNPCTLNGPHIRTLEWKHLMPVEFASRIKGSLLTTEIPITPENPTDYEYPFPDQKNIDLYERYRSRAAELSDVVICGRLGEYRYYDMDHAISRALQLAGDILAG